MDQAIGVWFMNIINVFCDLTISHVVWRSTLQWPWQLPFLRRVRNPTGFDWGESAKNFPITDVWTWHDFSFRFPTLPDLQLIESGIHKSLYWIFLPPWPSRRGLQSPEMKRKKNCIIVGAECKITKAFEGGVHLHYCCQKGVWVFVPFDMLMAEITGPHLRIGWTHLVWNEVHKGVFKSDEEVTGISFTLASCARLFYDLRKNAMQA